MPPFARTRAPILVVVSVVSVVSVVAVAAAGCTSTNPPERASEPSVETRGSGSGDWWRPTSEAPLALHWVLDQPLDLDDPLAMGLVDPDGNRLPPPDVYDIDGQTNSAETVEALQRMGKIVICYIDAGVFEGYRPDAHRFPSEVIGRADVGWDDSRWLDIRQIDVLEPIMRARIEDCRAKGFDAVEPDEIDGYQNDSGFPLTYQDQLAYNRAVAGWVHEAGLSVGLKGDIEQVADLEPYFDWTLNEECFRFDECELLRPFVDAGKAVWIAEYRQEDLTAGHCAQAAANRWNAARYRLGLPADGGRIPCRGW